MQQLEDMELPSLPSFQHDINYDSEMSDSGGDSSDEDARNQGGDESREVSNCCHMCSKSYSRIL